MLTRHKNTIRYNMYQALFENKKEKKNNSKILTDKVKVLEPELRGGSDPSRSINKKLGNRKAKN